MELAKYKACICEGSAENAIMDILLDNDLILLAAIRKYHEISKIRKGEYTLLDFLTRREPEIPFLYRDATEKVAVES